MTLMTVLSTIEIAVGLVVLIFGVVMLIKLNKALDAVRRESEMDIWVLDPNDLKFQRMFMHLSEAFDICSELDEERRI